jgi:hypothetical protein
MRKGDMTLTGEHFCFNAVEETAPEEGVRFLGALLTASQVLQAGDNEVSEAFWDKVHAILCCHIVRRTYIKNLLCSHETVSLKNYSIIIDMYIANKEYALL